MRKIRREKGWSNWGIKFKDGFTFTGFIVYLLIITYDGPGVKEKIYLNSFSLPFIGERK